MCGISVACSGVAALIGPDHPYQGGPPFPPIRGVDLSILLSLLIAAIGVPSGFVGILLTYAPEQSMIRAILCLVAPLVAIVVAWFIGTFRLN